MLGGSESGSLEFQIVHLSRRAKVVATSYLICPGNASLDHPIEIA